MSHTSAQSANRKYTQLSVDDASRLFNIVGEIPIMDEQDERIQRAVGELVKRTREVPNAHICLAYAVVRRGVSQAAAVASVAQETK